MSHIFNRFPFLILFFVGTFFLNFSALAQDSTSAVTVDFDKLWVDYDVRQDGELGMIIHTGFTVHQMLEVDAYLTIRIQNESDERLTSSTQGFRNQNGDLAIFKSFKPAYIDALFRDLSVFMPYREIKLAGGPHNLKIDADLIYENGDLIQHLIFHDFEFTGGSQVDPTPSSAIAAKFERMWIDYDITQGGELGMLMHVTFSVQQMKGVSGQIAYGFEMENGDRLYSSNDLYKSKNGQLTIYRDINPTYDDSFYEDLQVFMPYRELTVGEGSNALRIHVDVIYGDGGNVHLTYYNFTFTRDF